MAKTNGSNDLVYGFPEPAQNSEDSEYNPYPYYYLLPGPSSRFRRRRWCGGYSAGKVLSASLFVFSLGAFLYMVFPMKPIVQVTGISLETMNLYVDDQWAILPSVHLDVSLNLTLKITNPNFFGVEYDNVTIYVYYRGDELGEVESFGGSISLRSVSTGTALLNLQSAQLFDHATELIADVANREVPLQTVTVFTGALKMFVLSPQMTVAVTCDMLLDPKDKVVLSKECTL